MNLEEAKTPQELRSQIDSVFHDCWRMNERKNLKMRTFMNFFRAKQHAIDAGPNQEDPVEVDSRVAFEVVQLTRPTIRQEVAGFLNTIPNMDPIPSMSGVVASERARASARVENSKLRCYPEYYETLYNARLSAAIYGAAWIKQFWNPYEFRNGKMVGDNNWQFCSILDVVVDYRATNEKSLRYVFHRRAVTREQAEMWWPQDMEGNPTKGKFCALTRRTMSGTYQDLEQAYVKGFAGVKANELVEVIECWIKPSPAMPQGGLIIWSGGILLDIPSTEDGQMGLPDNLWPWVLINGLNKVPDKLYADGLMPDLLPLQITVNFLASKLRESTGQSSMSTLVTSRDSEIGEGSIDNMDGTVLEVTGDVRRAVAWQQGPGPQSGVMQYTEQVFDWWNRVGTQPDASRGITNGQANAKLLSFQQELGDSTHAPDRIMWGNQVATLLRNDLRLMHAHYDHGRYIRILGPNDVPMALSFDAEDYDVDVDFIFDPMNTPPTNRELAEAKVMEAYQMGVLDDTPQAKRARSMVRRFQDGSDVRDPKEQHRNRVRQEQVQLIQFGKVPQVLDRDDDAVHLEEDEVFTISNEFLDMPLEIQEGYLQHMIMHQKNYAMKQQGLAAQTQTLDPTGAGAPSQAGAPPGGKPTPTGGPEGGKRTAESPGSGGASSYPDSVSSETSAYNGGQ